MMEYQFYDDGKNRFLRLKTEATEEETFEARMIMNNQPEGLLRMHPLENEAGVFYDYNVTGLASLKDCEGEILLGNYLRSILFRLEALSDILYEYMLFPEKIQLQETMIFLRRETGQVFFVYDPSKKETFQNSLERLMEYFLKRLNPAEEKEVLLLYGLYAKSREPNVGMGTLAEYWRNSAGTEQEINEEPQLKHASEEELKIYEDLGLESFSKRREVDETVDDPIEVLPYPEEFLTIAKEEEGVVKKIKKVLKTYAFEIAVGIIVLGGTIAILLR